MAFRDDLEAARSRVDALERELRAVKEERDGLRADVERLERELKERPPKPEAKPGKPKKLKQKMPDLPPNKATAGASAGQARSRKWLEYLPGAIGGLVGLIAVGGGVLQSCAEDRARDARKPPQLVQAKLFADVAWSLRGFLVPGRAQFVELRATRIDAYGRVDRRVKGELSVELTGDLAPLERPADLRPGAPVPPDARKCKVRLYVADSYVSVSRQTGCDQRGGPPPACDPVALIARAVAAGAPANGYYQLAYRATPYSGQQPWVIELHDGVERVFHGKYDWACEPPP